MLGVQKGTGVTLVCPKGDYKTLYTGGTLVSCPYDGEALVLADAGGVQAKKIPSGIGRKDLGYLDDKGTPTYNVSGKLQIVVEPYGMTQWPGDTMSRDYPSSGVIIGGSASGTSFINNKAYRNNTFPFYKFVAPVSGIYYVGSDGSPYNLGSIDLFYDNSWHHTDFLKTFTKQYDISKSLDAGDTCYLFFNCYTLNATGRSYKYRLNPVVVFVDPLNDSFSSQTNITINKNTWNGNIYQDNSTNLTYIYPQYTTINENNETVTNISNNPIIYNNETKQYYTYDSVTNNYYYITYETPTPSPSPDPGTDPTPTPEPGEDTGDTSGIMKILQEIKAVLVSGFAGITEKLQNIGVGGSTPETAKPGSSSGGQSWWEKLLGKIGDAIMDGLLGAISAVLKLIFKLFTTILGWIIWLVSQVLTLFPFLPPGLGALLIGGVVVCFIIGLIKFIRG